MDTDALPVSSAEPVSPIVMTTILDVGNVRYRSGAPGDFGKFLDVVRIYAHIAPFVTEITLDEQLDGQLESGILKFGEAYGLTRMVQGLLIGEDSEETGDSDADADDVDMYESDCETDKETDSDHETSVKTVPDNGLESDSVPPCFPSTLVHPFQVAYEDLVMVLVGDLDNIPQQVYLDLILALLSAFKNLEYLYLPRAWKDIFKASVLDRHVKVGFTEDLVAHQALKA